MKHINGKKIEFVILEVYQLFEKNKLTGAEASAIAGMILQNAAIMTLREHLKEQTINQKETP